MPPLPEIPRGALVVVGGRAPIWRYGMALHALHGSPAGAVAFYDPKLGAVVVASHRPEYVPGEVRDIAPPAGR
ncbi:MAG: CRISPR-associated ring nuclease Crn3/Csx3 [Planctomycetota bacterium]|nr:CRISPR-associated ring nuclease Crn3/Csx3 [Planctomycetota bacterium]